MEKMIRERKTIGIGVDYSPMSILAVKWVAKNFASSGDQVILVHAAAGKLDDQSQKELWEENGSPLVPLSEFKDSAVQAHYDVQPNPEIFDILDDASMEYEMEVMAKIYWGDAREILCKSVKDLKLDHLVVGSRGHSMMKRLVLGSVSHHVMNHAQCPVTVVKAPKPPNPTKSSAQPSCI